MESSVSQMNCWRDRQLCTTPLCAINFKIFASFYKFCTLLSKDSNWKLSLKLYSKMRRFNFLGGKCFHFFCNICHCWDSLLKSFDFTIRSKRWTIKYDGGCWENIFFHINWSSLLSDFYVLSEHLSDLYVLSECSMIFL